jgi:hypothetical protein
VHDHSAVLVRLFSGWLHHLSRARGREIFRIHRLDCGGLLSDSRLARSVGVCDAAVGHFDACSGFSSQMGPAQVDRALDNPNLALRVNHRSSRLPNALPMVSSTYALGDVRSAVLSGPRTKFRRCQNLALNGDLMFDQDDVLQRVKEILW